jgi:hypothetical protein
MSMIKQLKIGILSKNHGNSTFSLISCVNRYLLAVAGAGSGTETFSNSESEPKQVVRLCNSASQMKLIFPPLFYSMRCGRAKSLSTPVYVT